jgi:hypothetical protein
LYQKIQPCFLVYNNNDDYFIQQLKQLNPTTCAAINFLPRSAVIFLAARNVGERNVVENNVVVY